MKIWNSKGQKTSQQVHRRKLLQPKEIDAYNHTKAYRICHRLDCKRKILMSHNQNTKCTEQRKIITSMEKGQGTKNGQQSELYLISQQGISKPEDTGQLSSRP